MLQNEMIGREENNPTKREDRPIYRQRIEGRNRRIAIHRPMGGTPERAAQGETPQSKEAPVKITLAILIGVNAAIWLVVFSTYQLP